jgi:CheY-like chemotaxis protein
LPVDAAGIYQEREERSVSRGANKMRALLSTVEKNFSIVLGRELEDLGCSVDLLADGIDLSSQILRSPAYEIILLDMMTSCLADLAMLRKIKKECPDTHVIVFSDRIAAGETHSLERAGADVFFARHELQMLKYYLLCRQGDAYRERLQNLFVERIEDRNREW